MSHSLETEFRQELHHIAHWWIKNTVDEKHGGFVGEITNDNEVRPEANKGIILNTRILWFFSEAAIFTKGAEQHAAYASHAQRAYDYLLNHFVDEQHGGVYWELDAHGKLLNSRKQIYAQAFAIYALASYFKLTGDENALNLAYKLFELIEMHALDKKYEGYIEAFNGDWSELDDFRLSPKDLNSPKSMNTHLHVLEAYTNLYVADKHRQVGDAIKRCLDYFDRFIIDHDNAHLRMFQSMAWEDQSNSISYGHDIESSWLIWEALESLGESDLKKRWKPLVIKMANTCLQQAVGEHHEVLDAYNYKDDVLSEERVWWVQAEALVGFYTAWHLTRDEKFKRAAEDVWQFIKRYQKDDKGGEWHWLATLDAPHRGDYKMGFWKAPYHNGRAMMEAIKLCAKP